MEFEGQFRNCFGDCSGVVWDHSRLVLGSLGIMCESFGSRSGVVQEMCGGRSGVARDWFGSCSGGHLRIILGSFESRYVVISTWRPQKLNSLEAN